MGPILYWDLVRFVRRRAYFVHRTLLACIAGGFVLFSASDVDPRSVGSIAHLSEIVSAVSFILQTLAIYFFIPAMLSGSICDDRRVGRLDLLLATPLTKQRIVFEKLLVGLALALSAMLTLLPFTLLGPIMGGVDPNAVLKAEMASCVETVFVAAVTLMISARSANGAEALIKSYIFLFVLRFAAPHLESLIAMISPGTTQPEFWEWFNALSPKAAAEAAWIPDTAKQTVGPSLGILLLILIALASAAFLCTVKSLDQSPVSRSWRSSSRSSASDEELLDSDPLVWRAVNFRIYDRNGGWRLTTWILAAVFACMVGVSFVSTVWLFFSGIVVFVIVTIVNSTAPTQWLIQERKSGWFSELQFTPLSMDDVLRSSIEGTSHHLRPLWRMAIAASLIMVILAAIRDYRAAAGLFVLQFALSWPAWTAYWNSVRFGFTEERPLPALAKSLGATFARLWTAAFIGMLIAHLASAVLFDTPSETKIFGMCICLVVVALYSMVFFMGRDVELRKARTALFVMDKTCNFGRKGGDAAWSDWVGVRQTPGDLRPSDVFHASLPQLHGRRRL